MVETELRDMFWGDYVPLQTANGERSSRDDLVVRGPQRTEQVADKVNSGLQIRHRYSSFRGCPTQPACSRTVIMGVSKRSDAAA